ncbi:MAG: hypothetical protein AB4057_05105 [Crocosphaera sp.]
MTLTTIGRVPIDKPGPLLDPHIKDNNALIAPAEDFTVSINTISLQLYQKYKSHYLAGQWDNDYFALVSQMGLGDQETPILKVHYLNHIDNLNLDQTKIWNKTTIWAENVATVEDFQKARKSQRLYLSFSSFCQGLGDSTLEQVTSSLKQVASAVGGVFPSLVPYTTLGNAALEGINNIVKTVLEARFKPQVKTSTFALYPAQLEQRPVIGEAPLQTGAYAFFFEPVTLENLQMQPTGIITATNNETVSPYIVVNIKKGLTLAPSQIEKNLAVEVLEAYNRTTSYSLAPTNTSIHYFDALEELGKTIHLASSTKRYFELKQKGELMTEAEKKRLEILLAYLKANFKNFSP